MSLKPFTSCFMLTILPLNRYFLFANRYFLFANHYFVFANHYFLFANHYFVFAKNNLISISSGKKSIIPSHNDTKCFIIMHII